jgi:5-methyltetrahydrofolate--homocysteine methyltransferase
MAIADIYNAVIEFRTKEVSGLVQKEIESGTPWQEIMEDGLVAPLGEVGEKFSKGELFVPEMLVAAKSVKSGMAVLKPLMVESGSEHKGTIVIGTVKGDMHDIGKNLVAMMLEGAGFLVVDVGVDVSAETFIQAVNDHKADIVGLSALLTTTMPQMKAIAASIRESLPDIKILVGGAPVSDEFAKQIGADAYGKDASEAASRSKTLMA